MKNKHAQIVWICIFVPLLNVDSSCAKTYFMVFVRVQFEKEKKATSNYYQQRDLYAPIDIVRNEKTKTCLFAIIEWTDMVKKNMKNDGDEWIC